MLIFRAFNFILYDIVCVLCFLMCMFVLFVPFVVYVCTVCYCFAVCWRIKDDDDDNDDKMWPTVTDVGHTG